jgi:surface polysaccharide O-acyltransferase-like enzyme
MHRTAFHRSSKWLVLVLAVLGISCTSAAWADSSPIGASPDEGAHILYSWGVVTGQVLPWNSSEWTGDEGTKWVEVTYPAAFDDRPSETCYMFKPTETPCAMSVTEKSALDAGTEPSTSSLAHGSTYMSRYPPLYYLFTGVAAWIGLALNFNGVQALLLARFVSGLISLGIMAWSAGLIARRFSPAIALIATSFTLTPQFLSLAASINPNGFEIAAAFALATAIVTARNDLENSGTATKEVWVFLVGSSLALAFARPASIVWACLLWLLLLLPLRRTRRPALFALSPSVMVTTALISLAGLAWFVYENLSRNGGISGKTDTTWDSMSPQLRLLVIVLHFGTMIQDAFELLGWGDTRLPTLAFVVWLILGAFVVGRLFSRTPNSALQPLWAALFFALSLLSIVAQSYAAVFGWQGRYLLPVIAASLVLVIPNLSERESAKGSARRLALASVFVATVIASGSLVVNLFRYAFGFSSMPSRFDDLPIPTQIGAWLPAGGLDAVLFSGVVGAFLFILAAFVLLRFQQSSTTLHGRDTDTINRHGFPAHRS